jgi:hypothetical protein
MIPKISQTPDKVRKFVGIRALNLEVMSQRRDFLNDDSSRLAFFGARADTRRSAPLFILRI